MYYLIDINTNHGSCDQPIFHCLASKNYNSYYMLMLRISGGQKLKGSVMYLSSPIITLLFCICYEHEKKLVHPKNIREHFILFI